MTATTVTFTRHHVTQHTRRAECIAPAARFVGVQRAVADIAAGRAVVLLDDTGPATEGELVIAAQTATTERVAFMVRHGSGFLCVPLPVPDCDRLALPAMHTTYNRGCRPAYTVTVDAASGIGTGISAADRATTIRLLADASTCAEDLTRPGHVVPQHTEGGGVLDRPGRPEAAVDLVRAAGLRSAAATCTIVSVQHPLDMAAIDELHDFAADQGLATVALSDVVMWRRERQSNTLAPAIGDLLEPQANDRADEMPRPDRRVTA